MPVPGDVRRRGVRDGHGNIAAQLLDGRLVRSNTARTASPNIGLTHLRFSHLDSRSFTDLISRYIAVLIRA